MQSADEEEAEETQEADVVDVDVVRFVCRHGIITTHWLTCDPHRRTT